mmetsp:Transcript_22899/g.71755  ORF Transcript_22899/g.71755 Transcript_22899/m.71755 type:complete len:423 (+) Transcript_22899:190-1458(+)
MKPARTPRVEVGDGPSGEAKEGIEMMDPAAAAEELLNSIKSRLKRKYRFPGRRFFAARADARSGRRRRSDAAKIISKDASRVETTSLDARYRGCYSIDPLKNNYAQWWDAVICVALVYTALVPPAEVAFSKPSKGPPPISVLFLINQAVNVVFFFDMLLQFFLHVQLPKSQGSIWIRNHGKIVRRYLKGAFFLDFVSIIPFGALTYTGMAVFSEMQAVRLLRLLRLVKLLRMLRGSRLIMRYRASMTLSITGANLMGFIVFTILASHWLACAWGFAGNLIGTKENSWMGPFLDGGSEANPVPWNIEEPKIQFATGAGLSPFLERATSLGRVAAPPRGAMRLVRGQGEDRRSRGHPNPERAKIGDREDELLAGRARARTEPRRGDAADDPRRTTRGPRTDPRRSPRGRRRGRDAGTSSASTSR